MPFKPLTSSKKPEALAKATGPAKDIGEVKSHELDKVSERIHIIYDDSGSMDAEVQDDSGQVKNKQVLAGEATKDFLKNCTPYTTAVEIAPLNDALIALTTNLPQVSALALKLEPTGGTPLFQALGKAVDTHPEKKFTHIVIFTDGAATDSFYMFGRPTLFKEAKALGIPIDLIIIGDIKPHQLSEDQEKFKELAESTSGTFLICKDGKAFREKMKYFAPTLRYMLPQIASKES